MDGAELLLLSTKPHSKIGESVRPPVTTNLMALLILLFVFPGFGSFGEFWNSRLEVLLVNGRTRVEGSGSTRVVHQSKCSEIGGMLTIQVVRI